ncbi:hypothetical protein BJ875DRAFT_460807 [Amylocarpus encephaloides]|uniref:Uncharacterized protein n=1 Tax=Amylocarpus encephaloides TaxID=45428 RepID=A0A9P7YJS0_9HELO|nr:hypothetical protein BJ875DRAFT_460807 [Amylocarpus encephaloides]
MYFAYLHFYMVPHNISHGLRAQEHPIVHALLGSPFLPTGGFIFGLTANPSMHCIIPLIGVVIFVSVTFLIL